MFKFVDRKQADSLMVVGGWGFDYRILSDLDLPYNYFLFCGQTIASFDDELEELLG